MKVITNAPYIERRMKQTSANKIREVQVHSLNSHSNEINPEEYNTQMFKGLIEQMIRDGRIGTGGEIGSVTAEEPSGINIDGVA